jgi:hypothetical protein
MPLSKHEVQRLIAKHLETNPKTQLRAMQNVVERELELKGIIGEKTEGNQYIRHTWTERISDHDALLINEVIYDFLYGRIITPGIDSANSELPWVHVSDKEKLKEYL